MSLQLLVQPGSRLRALHLLVQLGESVGEVYVSEALLLEAAQSAGLESEAVRVEGMTSNQGAEKLPRLRVVEREEDPLRRIEHF